VIVVTPVLVKPVDSDAALHLPTDKQTMPSDLERILLQRQVGKPQSVVPVQLQIPGDAGFVVQ
jgi:Flp pilus assembly secretin CpaC